MRWNVLNTARPQSRAAIEASLTRAVIRNVEMSNQPKLNAATNPPWVNKSSSVLWVSTSGTGS